MGISRRVRRCLRCGVCNEVVREVEYHNLLAAYVVLPAVPVDRTRVSYVVQKDWVRAFVVLRSMAEQLSFPLR